MTRDYPSLTRKGSAVQICHRPPPSHSDFSLTGKGFCASERRKRASFHVVVRDAQWSHHSPDFTLRTAPDSGRSAPDLHWNQHTAGSPRAYDETKDPGERMRLPGRDRSAKEIDVTDSSETRSVTLNLAWLRDHSGYGWVTVESDASLKVSLSTTGADGGIISGGADISIVGDEDV